MDKAVIISIHPKWCEKIALGQKTIEIRKTRPKIETPFKCYIYETQHAIRNKWLNVDNPYKRVSFARGRGQVIGEFICDKIIKAECGEYVKIPANERAMDVYDLLDYADGKTIYGWHISDLTIYDTPKELSNFCTRSSVLTFNDNGKRVYTGMKRPPQSWCYVEEICVRVKQQKD